MAAPVLVLSGGNALGAYHAGAWTALAAAGVEPRWVLGSSIGAVTAAIIAGTAPGEREPALRRFWDRAAVFDGVDALIPDLARRPLQYAQALGSRLLGRPGLFTLRPDLTGADSRPGLFEASAMRRLIAELVDFGRLNGGPMRVSIVTVDLATGEETVFDSRDGGIEIDHIMASAALLPDFPPVEVAGRLLVDGGLSANLPVDRVLDEAFAAAPEPLAIFAVDLFPSAAPLPRGLAQAAQRQSDLIFASQTKKMLTARALPWRDRLPGADVMLLAYEALAEETPLKGFDFSARSLARRWQAGAADMEAQLAVWRGLRGDRPGLAVHARAAGASPS
jgi:NTE family protein